MPSEVNAEGHVPELIYTPAGILLFVIWVHATPGSDNHPSHYTEFDLVILALHKCGKSMFNPGSCPHSINAIHSTGRVRVAVGNIMMSQSMKTRSAEEWMFCFLDLHRNTNVQCYLREEKGTAACLIPDKLGLGLNAWVEGWAAMAFAR